MTIAGGERVAGGSPILDRFRAQALRRREREAMRTLDGEAISWGAWHEASRRFAAALLAAGVPRGARVAVLASNSPAWAIADVGALLAGMVGVGLYPTSAAEQVAAMLADSEARVVVVDTAEQLAKVRAARARLPQLQQVIAVEPDAAGATSWETWLAEGEAALARESVVHSIELAERDVRPDDTAVLIYTSGSTGRPKGACISHRCLAASAASVQETLGLTADDTSLSLLPLSHAGERIFGMYTRIHVGMSALMVDDPSRVWEAARTYEPTLFGGLPRFYEKAFEALQLEEEKARRGEPARPQREVLASLFGRRVRLATSGGAPLPSGVGESLAAAGMSVLGAYGLTEHLCVAFHRPGRAGFDSVGLPMPGTEVRIADDGELLVRRSALTFSGYLDRPDETRASFTPDGEWLHTGDLASVAGDGQIRITGRKKELIALSTGRKVSPLPIESALTDGTWIARAMLYGDGRKFISAVLCLDPGVEALAQANDAPGERPALADRPETRHAVQAIVDRVNGTLSRSEQVKGWLLVPHDFSVAGGELTPTLKLRRAAVYERYASLLDPLYE